VLALSTFDLVFVPFATAVVDSAVGSGFFLFPISVRWGNVPYVGQVLSSLWAPRPIAPLVGDRQFSPKWYVVLSCVRRGHGYLCRLWVTSEGGTMWIWTGTRD
jgi:hypothetical protein